MAGVRPAPGLRFPVGGLVIGLAVALLPGCGEKDVRTKVYPVRGQVKFQGQPAPGAMVIFHPKSPPPAAPDGQTVPPSTAQVGRDGSFALTTYDGGDGAPPGDYRVTVLWTKVVGKGSDMAPGPNVIPAPYAKPDTTPLAVTVEARTNDLTPFVIR